eukprot:165648-Pelagomonas_calceolata.AAC.5
MNHLWSLFYIGSAYSCSFLKSRLSTVPGFLWHCVWGHSFTLAMYLWLEVQVSLCAWLLWQCMWGQSCPTEKKTKGLRKGVARAVELQHGEGPETRLGHQQVPRVGMRVEMPVTRPQALSRRQEQE